MLLVRRTGGIIYAANEWDEDVIVRINSVHSDWKLLPSRTKADLLIGYGRPRDGDYVAAFGRDCRFLDIFPLMAELHALRIARDGTPEFTDERFVETGPEVARVPNYEAWPDRESWCIAELERVAPRASDQ